MSEQVIFISGETLGDMMLVALERLVRAIDPADILPVGPFDELETELLRALAEARRVIALAKAVMR